jgi:ssDNA-binding Zn-finger/Zn-ribbon topoisomerase 1
MDRCPQCGKRLTAVFGAYGRTELQCNWCEPDPQKTEVGELESSLVPSLDKKIPEPAAECPSSRPWLGCATW